MSSTYDAGDLLRLWEEVVRGKASHDWSIFIALIKDADPRDFSALFGDLPNGAAFIQRLELLFQDHKLTQSSLIHPGGERLCFYVCPLERNAKPIHELLELARQDMEQRSAFLRRAGEIAHAEALEKLRFETRPVEGLHHGAAMQALEEFEFRYRHAGDENKPHWQHCLKEACYGIAASFEGRDWLMLPFSAHAPRDGGRGLLNRLGLSRPAPALDLDPSYQFWCGGGTAVIDGECCVVNEVERRAVA